MLEVAVLEHRDDGVVLVRAKDAVKLLLGHLAEEALGALAGVVDVEGCV